MDNWVNCIFVVYEFCSTTIWATILYKPQTQTGAIVAAILAVVMGARATASGKFMPAGVISLVGMVLALVNLYFAWQCLPHV